MNPIKEQLSQLVQDVIDGNESEEKATLYLTDLKQHITNCLTEIDYSDTNDECDASEFDLY